MLKKAGLLGTWTLYVGLGLSPVGAQAGSYYAASAVGTVPVLWSYAPTTNKLKLCYQTGTAVLGCTTPVAVFTVKPAATDNLQYRISNNDSAGASLWIVDETTIKTALCNAAANGSGGFAISCVVQNNLD